MFAQVEALLLLRGTLNVAGLEAAYEDDRSVYIVMELCRGGDIIKAMKSNPSNETMVRASHAACLPPQNSCAILLLTPLNKGEVLANVKAPGLPAQTETELQKWTKFTDAVTKQ